MLSIDLRRDQRCNFVRSSLMYPLAMCSTLQTDCQTTNVGGSSFPWRIKIVMACPEVLRGDSQTIDNSPLSSFSPTLNQSIKVRNLNQQTIPCYGYKAFLLHPHLVLTSPPFAHQVYHKRIHKITAMQIYPKFIHIRSMKR